MGLFDLTTKASNNLSNMDNQLLTTIRALTSLDAFQRKYFASELPVILAAAKGRASVESLIITRLSTHHLCAGNSLC